MTARGRAEASRVRAIAHLRWLQVREKRKELRPVKDFEATMARMLAMLRDRFMAVADRLPELTPAQRDAVRREISATLDACSHADL